MLYYKYLPCDRISYLNDELLRFTQPGDLNDPFECLPQKPNHEAIIKAVEEYFAKSEVEVSSEALNSISVNDLFNESYAQINQEIGIFSLSQKWNNALMWAHYAIAHKGFCVGFDPNHDFFIDYLSEDTLTSKTLKKVVYSEERSTIPPHGKLSFDPFITKSIDWEYEDEVRLIATLNLSHSVVNGTPMDIHLFKVPHSAIAEITVGANINPLKEEEIKRFCFNKGIPLYKAKISDLYFDMERTRISH